MNDLVWTAWLAAAATVAYTYVGYPALLWLLARRQPRPPVPAPLAGPPSVTLLIVARDEAARIADKLEGCLRLDYPRDALELVVVSDGSGDRTAAIVASFRDRGVRLIELADPSGKAAAFNLAVPTTTGNIIALTDARQDLAPDAVRRLVESLGDPAVGAVSGELHLAAPATAGEAGVGLYWRYEKAIRRLESRLDSTVGVTGAICALRRELFPPLDPRTVLDDVAIPMVVARGGHRVLFDSRAKAYDHPAEPRVEYARKVRTLAGNFQLLTLMPWLLNPLRNRLWWQFVSHKLLRLAVPWCLLTVLVGSAVLANAGSIPQRYVLLAQVTFYVLAGVGRWSPNSRLGSIPCAFVLLNAAAAAGLGRFLRGQVTPAWKGGPSR